MVVATFDNRPKCTYPGDVRAAVGQVMGPTLNREMLVIDEVTYDKQTNTSVARFRYATPKDFQ